MADAAERNILLESHDIIYGDREKLHGEPGFNLETIAEFWMVYLRRRHNVAVALLPEDICQMMVLLKSARLIANMDSRDSLRDQAGYAGLQDRIKTPTLATFAQDIIARQQQEPT